jgi:peptidoglycan/LPS O-acetylase OafA/YrhL
MNRATRLGLVATVVTLLGAAWLILAPFVVGYQPQGDDWVMATRNDLVVGGALVAVSGTALFSILVLSVRALRRAATLRAREDHQEPVG